RRFEEEPACHRRGGDARLAGTFFALKGSNRIGDRPCPGGFTMRSLRTMAFVLAAPPAAALAQTDYSTVTIIPSRPITVYRVDTPSCREQSDMLFDRKAVLDDRKSGLDREADGLAREGAFIADEMRQLDSYNPAEV